MLWLELTARISLSKTSCAVTGNLANKAPFRRSGQALTTQKRHVGHHSVYEGDFTSGQICYTRKRQLAPIGGVHMLQQILTLVVAPILVGIVIELFAYWLDKRDDN